MKSTQTSKKSNGIDAKPSKTENKGLDVGESIKITEDDAETIRTSEQAILSLQMTLGAEREKFVMFEARIMVALQKARQEHQSVIETIAKKSGVKIGEKDKSYEFNVDKMSFTRKS